MDPFIGQIELFPYRDAPRNWAKCEGQVMPITNSTRPLFALIGKAFGGDGVNTFALPDLRGKSPVPNLTYCIAMNGIMPPRP